MHISTPGYPPPIDSMIMCWVVTGRKACESWTSMILSPVSRPTTHNLYASIKNLLGFDL
jgi:hypothetical protein